MALATQICSGLDSVRRPIQPKVSARSSVRRSIISIDNYCEGYTLSSAIRLEKREAIQVLYGEMDPGLKNLISEGAQ
jgi:hypothetical protein